jgi:hypothetical protein
MLWISRKREASAAGSWIRTVENQSSVAVEVLPHGRGKRLLLYPYLNRDSETTAPARDFCWATSEAESSESGDWVAKFSCSSAGNPYAATTFPLADL